MKQFPNDIFNRKNKNNRHEQEFEFIKRQSAAYYTKVSELSDEDLYRGLEILRKSNDDECLKW